MTALLLSSGAQAQEPSERWRTVRTDNYSVHYPQAAQSWATDVATTLESIRERVQAEVGWVPRKRVHVLIADPVSSANGMALPRTWSPRMQLWVTPPGPDSIIGHSRSWSELLAVHEDTHLVHLLRDARNPFERAFQALLGVGPIARKSPRWVAEGYATVVEGRLTGAGRPNADVRASLLRRLAVAGRLPSYSELDGSSRWSGAGWAYLVGSAYLEWLEQRAGPGSLRNLWARMTARRMRSFSNSFRGVFGDSPTALYGEFVAQLTADAVQLTESRRVSEGTLFEDIGWNVASPSVSADGERVAVAVASRTGVPQIRVYSTEVNHKALEAKQARSERMLERDPQDVAAVDPAHPPHRVIRRRPNRSRVARTVRWLTEDRLLFDAWVPDGDGRFRPDLFVWEMGTRRDRRITKRQDLHSPDPSADGTWAVAVRTVWGQSQLVKVDLADDPGAWEVLYQPTGTVDLAEPRVSPDGTRIAWLQNAGQGWALGMRSAEGEVVLWQPDLDGPQLRGLAFDPSGDGLIVEAGQGGFIEARRLLRSSDGLSPPMTTSLGGALSPVMAPDGSLFHLSVSPGGMQLHRVEPGVPTPMEQTVASPLARRPTPTAPPPPPARVDAASRSYGMGARSLALLYGAGTASTGEGQGELGLHTVDLVGRYEMMLLGSLPVRAGRGVQGGQLSVAARILPVDLHAAAFGFSDQRVGLDRAGVVGMLSADHRFTSGQLTLEAGALTEGALSDSDEVGSRRALFGAATAQVVEPRRRLWGIGVGLRGSVGRVGVQGRPTRLVEAGIRGRLFRGPALTAGYEVGRTSGHTIADRFRLGGTEASVLPDPVTWGWVTDPVFTARTAEGEARDTVDAGLDLGGVSAFYRRHRIGNVLGPSGFSQAGLQVGSSFAGEPFLRIPSGKLSLGVSCVFEDALGTRSRACRELDHWGAWLNLTWNGR